MSRAVIKRQVAKQDVEAIAFYIAEDNPEAARRFVIAADATFKKLAEMPRLGVAQETTNPILAGLRRYPVRGFRNYLVFYRLIENGIEVLRVLHGMRDYPKLFG